MEIGITKKDILNRVFEKDEINGLYEIDSTLVTSYKVLHSFVDIPANLYLLTSKIRNTHLYDTLTSELEITQDILKKGMLKLSSGELIKILTLKACLTYSTSILLNHIDANLSFGDLNKILKCLRRNLKDINKTIIFSSNNMNNLVPTCTKYIILDNADVDYAGNSIDMLPEKTEIMKFIDMANDKNAKMSYYKDPSDLLKAIYRSVKK